MYQDVVLGLAKEAVYATLLVAAPILLGSLLIGLVISILQATTQIQEQTLTFVPKIIVVLVVIIVFGPWMLNTMVAFANNLLVNIPQFIDLR
ncbi:MAG TPA: flagellar biosynthesis protein FliQ [Syntrophothermus lipocalidus]|uniref:Flagellar biosynthetic protein FliQ n=1 Tax=Syntrophothermus lipocalidus (strain DSM 12680 / TGB-C1) TaxID=643648 RepID=D7CM14_SYNLT|nr:MULTISPECIES: flagellar biosynthesis protein FliQ [Syntrophothermus]ADI01749.1 flagellar biosynthetic protein FliQ [Syntrophothermus lipocalidus DSM 12680]NSW82423.1 flagellar biosynthesis protein FliQ [Syntrophothermus sp.]HHV77147.1 flagellar biosynthesis protein FliQ [Syntrophothermus lipocalidus]HOV42832.1 flagellar biosynthesis protein FliQ [Syntrophothermus lipocalidus]